MNLIMSFLFDLLITIFSNFLSRDIKPWFFDTLFDEQAVINKIISNKKTRAEMLIEQYNKTKKLDFLINHDENFSYSGF